MTPDVLVKSVFFSFLAGGLAAIESGMLVTNPLLIATNCVAWGCKAAALWALSMDGLGRRNRGVFECFFIGDFIEGVLTAVAEKVSTIRGDSGIVMRRGKLPVWDTGMGIVTILRRIGLVSAVENEGAPSLVWAFSNVSPLLALC